MDAVMLLSNWTDKVPKDKLLLLQTRLEEVDDSSAVMLSTLNLKDPFIAILLSVFLGYFGIDRFYKGDIVLGILKLLFSWITFGIWWVLDWFFVYKGIKEDNLQKILQALLFAKKKPTPEKATLIEQKAPAEPAAAPVEANAPAEQKLLSE